MIASSGLTTWSVTGEDAHLLMGKLKALPGVEQVVPFGNTLHASGHDAETLEKNLKSMDLTGYLLEKTDVNLEDVFISLMQQHGG